LAPSRSAPIDRLIRMKKAEHRAGNLGLGQPNSVSTYQHRYADMPRPVTDLGEGRCKLWLRPQIEAWARRGQQHSGPRKQGHGDGE
jgi:glutathione-regulated potassium-efflux system ancillary protein KefG